MRILSLIDRARSCPIRLRPLLLGALVLGSAVFRCADAAEPAASAGLHVQTFGSGPPIAFLHGGLQNFSSAYARQRDDLARSHTVIGIDQRGHGRSADDERPFSYTGMAEDTAAVLRRLALGPVDVVGHSDGGNVALILASRHPELVRRVVVSGANLRAGLPADELERRRTWTDAQVADKLAELEKHLPPRFRADYQALSPDGAAHWPIHLAKSYALWLTPVVIDRPALQAIRAPVLVIAGDKDFTSIEETAEIYRALPKGQLFIVPGSGHGTFEDRTTLVDLAIREFLER